MYVRSLLVKKWITFFTTVLVHSPKNTPKKGSYKKVSKAQMMIRTISEVVAYWSLLLVGQKVDYFFYHSVMVAEEKENVLVIV